MEISSVFDREKEYDLPVIDSSTINNLRILQESGEDDLIDYLMDFFKRTTPERILLIRQALNEDNRELLNKTVHSLKSTCGNIGAKKMEYLSSQLETHSYSHTTQELYQLLDKLQFEYHNVLGEIKLLVL